MQPEQKHLIHLSLNWEKALKSGLVGSAAEIGQHCGLTAGRVRQIVRLSGMASEIVGFLAGLEGEKALRGYSEARIRFIVALPRVNQVRAFEEKFGVNLSG
ncbi:MAG: hypothetical protein Q7Q71_08320 [Verrucomicrobiota bacterium JB023]|nr:hypothetical protein [Verrucomicrobiota bacterium JB023]